MTSPPCNIRHPESGNTGRTSNPEREGEHTPPRHSRHVANNPVLLFVKERDGVDSATSRSHKATSVLNTSSAARLTGNSFSRLHDTNRRCPPATQRRAMRTRDPLRPLLYLLNVVRTVPHPDGHRNAASRIVRFGPVTCWGNRCPYLRCYTPGGLFRHNTGVRFGTVHNLQNVTSSPLLFERDRLNRTLFRRLPGALNRIDRNHIHD